MLDWLQALTVAEVFAVLIGLGALFAGLKWIIPLGQGWHDFLTDWKGEPARPGVPERPGVMATLAAHTHDITEIKTQVKNSHGTNLRDDIDKIHKAVEDSIKDRKSLRESDKDLSERVSRLEAVVFAESEEPS